MGSAQSREGRCWLSLYIHCHSGLPVLASLAGWFLKVSCANRRAEAKAAIISHSLCVCVCVSEYMKKQVYGLNCSSGPDSFQLKNCSSIPGCYQRWWRLTCDDDYRYVAIDLLMPLSFVSQHKPQQSLKLISDWDPLFCPAKSKLFFFPFVQLC